MTERDRLAAVINRTRVMLLDFDGPVTHIFIDGRNHRVSGQMRQVLTDAGITLSAEIEATEDPLAVLRWSALEAPEPLRDAVENACVRGEVAAVDESDPTAGIQDLLAACQTQGRPVVVVSNNAEEAITAYLDRHGLRDQVSAIVGRTFRRPELMKPHPDSIQRALAVLDAQPEECFLLGDSVTAIEVCKATGVLAVGYAKHSRRGQQLRAPERMPSSTTWPISPAHSAALPTCSTAEFAST